MPPIVFPPSTAPGTDEIEGGGRLINAYAEKLPEGAPAPYVIRRTPGLTLFGESSETDYRGSWFDGSTALYAAYSANLSWFDEDGTETVIGGIPDGAVAYNGIKSSTSNLSSYTLTSVPFGDEDADRRIVVGIAAMEYEGSNLVTNGTFNTNLTGWTASNWAWDAGGGNGMAITLGAFAVLSQTITTVNGATYRIRVTPRGWGGIGATSFTVKWAGVAVATIAYAASAQTINVVASGTSNVLSFEDNVSQGSGIDDISVTRVQFALPTAVTIGGVAATNTVAATRAALWIANVPTTTSGSVVLTYAQTMNEAYIAVWRLGGVASDTPTDTDATTTTPGAASVTVPAGGAAIFMVQAGSFVSTFNPVNLGQDFFGGITSPTTNVHYGYSNFLTAAGTASLRSSGPTASIAAAVWQGSAQSLGNGVVTFAKNNATTPDQVLCASGTALVDFTTSAVSAPIDVNSEVPTSVCFGEGYFFVTTATGLCYASGVNAETFNALDVIRAEARPEPLLRGVFYDGELYLFGPTHIEVWASGGNPNATGFPLNRTTVIWRGLIAPLAVVGMEDGFGGPLIWVADDNTVCALEGYQATVISPPQLQRLIEACPDKANIRCAVYQVGGHRCVAVDLAGDTTWVYDLSEGQWHEVESHEHGHWVWTGNSVKAFGKWIGGHHHNGNLYYIDDTVYTEAGEPMPWQVESIAMEAFPQRLQVAKAEFNFVSGVGNATVPDPEILISWSDDGGHTWSDPVTAKLGENGRYKTQVRKNRLGLTGIKGRRFRLRVDDEVYVGLLAGSMEVSGRPG